MRHAFIFSCVAILSMLTVKQAVAEEPKSAFEICGESFFPEFVQSMVDQDFAWIYGTESFTSKDQNPSKKNARWIYTAAGALEIPTGPGTCKWDPTQTKQAIMAGWIREAKNQKADPVRLKEMAAACKGVKNKLVQEALAYVPAPPEVAPSNVRRSQ